MFEKANNLFLLEQSKLIISGVSERTLCGALMIYLHDQIKETTYSGYYVDIEYNRNNGKLKTIINENVEVIRINCDIIIHSRGENINKDNLIAIEMKKSVSGKKEKIKDKNRLIALTKDSFDDIWAFDGTNFPEHVCGYRLGVYYEVNAVNRNVLIEYYLKGKLFITKEIVF
ncbi:hypothetical protein [Paenibacillus lupini]|uniref:hypothetical protein n=1 Tax=Paenibacillus lupini TaxID=1450204 RepID=UPI001424234D|nr:hypothetical protein [Paenibacillus lupini]NIK22888.1 hypothetical protein [Paenibacillus lupini]